MSRFGDPGCSAVLHLKRCVPSPLTHRTPNASRNPDACMTHGRLSFAPAFGVRRLQGNGADAALDNATVRC